MTATRSRREEKSYKKYLKTAQRNTCAFCVIKKNNHQLVTTTSHFKIITNIFPYSLWDGQKVISHLMITPKRHTDSLSNMKPDEKVEYVDLIEQYEYQGYNIYARAPSSSVKSIIHQHTHLIKTDGKTRRFVFLIRKPYFRIVR
jgi:diadenosine tetraphosphate (Ap4A) HIT family hydrolase